MRRLLLLVSAIVLVETSFYAAVTPLLPYYVAHQHLTKTGAGVLVGAYAAGTLVASLPSGALAARLGPRTLLVAGLALLAVTSITFGLAHSVVVLDAARFAQGIGGAFSWTGGMSWVSASAPPERRGAALGTAMGAATAGALLGPVVGVVAHAIGTGVTFGAIGALALVMLGLTFSFGGRVVEHARGTGSLRAAFAQPDVARGLWIVVCTALMFGTINVLLPLRLDHAGASGTLIGAVWLLASALETVVTTTAGRISDRHGWQGLARFGLVAGACVAIASGVPHVVVPLVAIGIASGPFIGALWTPALVLLGHGSDEAGLDHTYAFALMNLAWAAAQTLASAGGGALAHATADIVPLAAVAAVALATAAVIAVRTRRPLRRAWPAVPEA